MAIRKKKGHSEFGDTAPRTRDKPRLNFQADSLYNIINWNDAKFEPVLTASIPTEELKLFLDVPMKVPTWAHWPNNTQSVERCIRLVSEAGKEVTGQERRDGLVLSKIAACKILPANRSKSDLGALLHS